jgi:hypothetical protein
LPPKTFELEHRGSANISEVAAEAGTATVGMTKTISNAAKLYKPKPFRFSALVPEGVILVFDVLIV